MKNIGVPSEADVKEGSIFLFTWPIVIEICNSMLKTIIRIFSST